MVKKGMYNEALEGVNEIIDMVSDSISGELKGVVPFDQEPVSPKERLMKYDELTPEEKEWGRQQFGDEIVLPYFERMEALKRRYSDGRTLAK